MIPVSAPAEVPKIHPTRGQTSLSRTRRRKPSSITVALMPPPERTSATSRLSPSLIPLTVLSAVRVAASNWMQLEALEETDLLDSVAQAESFPRPTWRARLTDANGDPQRRRPAGKSSWLRRAAGAGLSGENGRRESNPHD